MNEIAAKQRVTYLRGLLQRYGTLSLPLGSGLSFSLIQVFQPLRLRQSAIHENMRLDHDTDEEQHSFSADDEEANDSEEHTAPEDLLAENGLEALSKSPSGRIVILGGPGTGKTTVLKHLLCYQAQLALEESTTPLPIFLSLPDLARAGHNLDAYLTHIARDMGLETHDGQALSHAIQQGRAFICLDSLDEVLPRLRSGIIRQINGLARESGNTWIVGSRFTDYKGGQFQQGQFQEWELQTLDEPRRLQLASQLLPELQRQLTTSSQPAHSLDTRAYVQALGEHRQAATWGENPLLFSLGAVVYLRRGSLAGSRSTLYREVINALLETREQEVQQREHLRSLLADVALELYQFKGRTFNTDDLLATLTLLNVEQRATWHIDDALYRILSVGLLDVVAYETYSFRHQTFQEYLVALALAQRFMSEDATIRNAAHIFAWSKHTYSRWHEIERLLVGILVQEYGADGMRQAVAWLTRLLQQQNSPEGDPGNLSLELALKVLGEVAELEEWLTEETLALEEMAARLWSAEVIRSEKRSQQDRYRLMAAEIGRLRPATQEQALEPLLKEFMDNGYNQLDTIIGAIHSSHVTHYLLEALQRYPHANYQRRIKSVFTYSGQFAPISFLLAELNSQNYGNIIKACGSLTKLAPYVPAEKIVPVLHLNGFGRPQAAEDILKAIAKVKDLPLQDLLPLLQSEERKTAFRVARVLACAQHPAAIDLLLASLKDSNPVHRRQALEALEEYKTQVPLATIVPLLEDSDSIVRTSAVGIIAHFGADASLQPLLQAAHDPHTQVCQKAIEALGQLGDQAPLEVLIQATDDPQSWVARTALLALGRIGHRVPLELFLRCLQKRKLLSATLEAFSTKNMAGHVPIQPLLDLYERHWLERGDILNALNNTRQPVATALLLDALSTYPQDEGIVAARLLEKQAAHPLMRRQLEGVADRCVLVSQRALALLGCWPERSSTHVLWPALIDERWQVSDVAASKLCERANELDQTEIVALLNHKHAWVRKNALQVLRECTMFPPLDSLIAALHDSDHQVRQAAIQVLEKHPDDVPLDELVAATLDNSIRVRQAAALALSKRGQRNPTLAISGAMNLLRDAEVNPEGYSDWDAFEAAWEAFGNLGSFVPSEILLQALHDTREISPRFAAHALQQMGERAPVDQLVLALQDRDQYLRQAAVFALSMSGKHAPVAALINVLKAKNPLEMRKEVITTLTRISEHGDVPDEVFLQNILKKRDYSTYEPLFKAFTVQGKYIPEELVAEALGHFPHKNTSVVLQYLCQFPELISTFPEEKIAVALALYDAGQQHWAEPDTAQITKCLLPKLSVESLLKALTHAKNDVRLGTLSLLAAYPGMVPLEPIVFALHDPEYRVRKAAIEYFYKQPENLPIEPIISCLRDSNAWVCVAAIKALANLGTQAPLPDLIAMLDAPASEIRSAAIEALAQPGLCGQVPIELFMNALGEHYDEERPGILHALRVKDPQVAIAYCIATLGDSDGELALTAFQILQELDPTIIPEIVQEASELLQGGKPGRFFRSLSMSFLADIIGEMGYPAPELTARLGELLDWPYWEVRMKAAQALGKLRRNIPDAMIRHLLELRHDPRSRAVREAADEALAEILSLETGIEDD